MSENQGEATVLMILLTAAVLALAGPAEARSKAARYLIDQQISEACNGGKGSISDEVLVERGLTGDGRDDLIIDHAGIQCDGAGMSGFCGAQVCSLLIYVRQGDLLKLEVDSLGSVLEISDDPVPVLSVAGHGGNRAAIRWDGKRFR